MLTVTSFLAILTGTLILTAAVLWIVSDVYAGKDSRKVRK